MKQESAWGPNIGTKSGPLGLVHVLYQPHQCFYSYILPFSVMKETLELLRENKHNPL